MGTSTLQMNGIKKLQTGAHAWSMEKRMWFSFAKRVQFNFKNIVIGWKQRKEWLCWLIPMPIEATDKISVKL